VRNIYILHRILNGSYFSYFQTRKKQEQYMPDYYILIYSINNSLFWGWVLSSLLSWSPPLSVSNSTQDCPSLLPLAFPPDTAFYFLPFSNYLWPLATKIFYHSANSFQLSAINLDNFFFYLLPSRKYLFPSGNYL